MQHIQRRSNELKDAATNLRRPRNALEFNAYCDHAGKQPKRPNNNAKALESWESEGGAPASDDRSTKRKRPRVLNQITKAQPLTNHKQKPKRT
jgi:hypothetical protein